MTALPLGQYSEHGGTNADGQKDGTARSDLVSWYSPVTDDPRAQPHDVIVAPLVHGRTAGIPGGALPEPGRERSSLGVSEVL